MKFSSNQFGQRVIMHNPPEDRLFDETGTLICYHAQDKNKVVVQCDRRYTDHDDGIRICDEDYVDLTGGTDGDYK